MSFKEELTLRVQNAERILAEKLPAEEGLQRIILETMNYSVLGGGKRLRPILMQESYRLFGGDGPEIEPFMAAMEMIHAASLVHDDLPAMDNDDYRRGRLTAWKKYGEAMAILAGDGLMIYAFETASRALRLGADPDRVGEAIRILAEKTGIYGMIGGQTVDVALTGKPISEEELYFIYALKTGALLEASLMIGAVLAGAQPQEVETVRGIALDVGLAFQIQDDILDLTSTTQELGKPVLSDEKNHKTTYVSLHGLAASEKKVEELSLRAIAALSSLPYENPFLSELIRNLITRKN